MFVALPRDESHRGAAVVEMALEELLQTKLIKLGGFNTYQVRIGYCGFFYRT